jgi:hypothetical protein
MVKRVKGQWGPLVSLTPRLTGGPPGQVGIKGKKECLVWFGFGPKEVMGRLEAQLDLARLAGLSSACGSAGRLGLGLARLVGWLGLPVDVGFEFGTAKLSSGRIASWAAAGRWPPPLSPSPRRLLPLAPSSLTGRTHTSVIAGSGVAGPDLVRQVGVCVCMCGRRGRVRV